MRTFAARTFIEAPPERVWAILTNAPRYPEWNPTVTRLDGPITLGARISLYAATNPGRPFDLTVTVFEAPARMVWRGGMPMGLFLGERIFTLDPARAGVDFAMRETFTGALAPVLGRVLPDLQPSFDAFVAALKREAERPIPRPAR
jgi:hypothetical protein